MAIRGHTTIPILIMQNSNHYLIENAKENYLLYARELDLTKENHARILVQKFSLDND